MALFSRRFGLVAALAVGLAAPAFAQAPAATPVRGGALTIGAWLYFNAMKRSWNIFVAASSSFHLPSPTSRNEPTMLRTWLCRKESASARTSISSP